MQNEKRLKIGVFDTGFGGLTVLRQLIKNLPQADYIFLGDNKRAPYGQKPISLIKKYSKELVDFLTHKNLDALVIACNTITAYCLEDIQKSFPDLLVVGTIQPAMEALKKSIQEGERQNSIKVGLIATSATVQSKEYDKAFTHYFPGHSLISLATPPLAALVEEGHIQDSLSFLEVDKALSPLKKENLSQLILGCTHYPVLKEEIQASLGPQVLLIDPAEAISQEVIQRLKNKILPSQNSPGQVAIYASDQVERYQEILEKDSFFDSVEYKIQLVHLPHAEK